MVEENKTSKVLKEVKLSELVAEPEDKKESSEKRFWKPVEGENIIVIAGDTYRVVDTKFGEKCEFDIVVDGSHKVFQCNYNSVPFKIIKQALKEGRRKVNIVRIGTTKSDTRYTEKK